MTILKKYSNLFKMILNLLLKIIETMLSNSAEAII